MKGRLFLFTFLFTLLLLTACNQQPKPEIDISKTVGMTEDYFRQLDEISTTASSYSEEQVKFRLMVEKHPSQQEATAMFNRILDKLEQNSHFPEFWDYYNGYFDIKSYDKGVIYQASKVIGEGLRVTSK